MFGIARTRRAVAAEPAREIGEADAGGDRQHDGAPVAREMRRERARGLAHLLRLHREDDEIRAGDRGARRTAA